MSISQFFILSPRGDTIIYRDYKSDISKDAHEIFFYNSGTSPIFTIDNINYISIEKSNLYFVIATKDNCSPSLFIEILLRIIKIIKDFLGILNEELIRKNFTLIYEILDELIDCGFPQFDSTEMLKPFVYTQPLVPPSSNPSLLFGNKNTAPSTSSLKPITNVTKNEIFVDFIEKLTLLFNSSGQIINSAIDGMINMKAFFKKNSEIMLSFTDDINFGGNTTYGTILDDYNLHACVNSKYLQSDRYLIINPPNGEFTLMNYRVKTEFPVPFKIFPYIISSEYKIEIAIKIRSMFPEKYIANNVIIKLFVPKSAAKIKLEVEKKAVGQLAEFNDEERACIWKIKKFIGGSETQLVVKINSDDILNCKKDLGPISLNFDIPMYNFSKLQVKNLKIQGNEKDDTLRWIRYMTQVSSYVARL
jgi:AP-4 complex subunit mu-1